MSAARKILIVDDDDDLRESLEEQLALYDEFELVSAPTAGKGLEEVRRIRDELAARIEQLD